MFRTHNKGTMQQDIATMEKRNDHGSCWTCVKRQIRCDGGLPRKSFTLRTHGQGKASQSNPGCDTCAKHRVRCRGFGIQIRLPDDVASRSGSRKGKKRLNERSAGSSPRPPIDAHVQSLSAWMPWPGLTRKDSFFMQHFLQNISKIALAVDYDGNGYRQLLPLAMEEPALANGILAVASSHHNRWQGVQDTDSGAYLRASTAALSQRFRQPPLIGTPTTLATMLILVSFEVFSGSNRWQTHYNAIRGWVKSRGQDCDVSPFLKAWVCLLDTQYSLNSGQPGISGLEAWLDTQPDPGQAEDTIDVLFGCSTQLPRLMRAASELELSRSTGKLPQQEVLASAEALQAAIRQTQIPEGSEPSLGVVCQQSRCQFTTLLSMDKAELCRRMVATAEIFRHCLHLFVFRVSHGPSIPLSDEMQDSLRVALDLLPIVPDALGPGANLGWCLVIIGSELDLVEERSYIRSRWAALEILGIHNCYNGKRGLEAVWAHRDGSQGLATGARRWQDVMQDRGETQILI
ncbi:hypothetical protein FALCPG4_011371 [Fusarium falciforme]